MEQEEIIKEQDDQLEEIESIVNKIKNNSKLIQDTINQQKVYIQEMNEGMDQSQEKMGASMKMKNISESMVLSIFDNYRNYKIRLKESFGYQQSQVTSGGVSLGDIRDDMTIVSHDGIFVIGELLDVDGRCGGYNLQWAFTSGSIAGTVASL